MKISKAAGAAGRAGPDFGPTVRRVHLAPPPPLPAGATGLQQRQARAAHVAVDRQRVVVKEDRPDPGKPDAMPVRGARVRDPLRMMFHAGSVTRAQWGAAEAFRDDVALANGARLAQPDSAGVRSPMTGANWPADARLAAMARVSGAWDTLHEAQREVVNWVVVEHGILGLFARARRMRRARATELLHAGLDALERCYRNRESQA